MTHDESAAEDGLVKRKHVCSDSQARLLGLGLDLRHVGLL